MTVLTRIDLAGLPDYIAGRSVPGTIKLASNEVPEGPLPSVRAAIAEAATAANRYPDIGARALTERLAEVLGVGAERIAVGCGSVSLCQQLVQATCTSRNEVVFGWRSFEAYPIVTKIGFATASTVPLTDGHALDPAGIAAAVGEHCKLVFVSNPNNPTGTLIRRAELERLLDAVPDDVIVALDEAYREFGTDPQAPDGIELARDRPNVVVLRTFSKAYGLAGLRVGYAVGCPELAAALRKVAVPFSVNAIAQAAALASLTPAASGELLARCADIARARDRLRAELLDAGYDVPESQANFVWLALGERTEEFDRHCLAHKILVRAFPPSGARVTIGTAEENAAFLAAARSFPGYGGTPGSAVAG
jgi:histidinol-phosphate aminotransferase